MLGDSLVALLSQPLWVFLTILARITPSMMLTPPLSSSGVPVRIRLLLSLCVAALLSPVASSSASQMPGDLFHVAIAMAGEVLLGLLLGSIILLAVACLQIAGQSIGQLAGLDFATSVDPSSNEEMPVLSNLLGLLAMAILLILGGHRHLMQCAMDSLARYPAGAVVFESHWLAELDGMLRHTFEVGLRAAAPISVALLLSNVVTGLLARTLPQLNILSIGFNLNIGALLVVLSIGLGGVTWAFQSELAVWLDSCHRIVAPEVN